MAEEQIPDSRAVGDGVERNMNLAVDAGGNQ